MTKSPRGSTWVTVDAGGGPRQVSAPEADPERPWRFEGLNAVTVDATSMSSVPSWHLVVGSLTDAAALESALPGAERRGSRLLSENDARRDLDVLVSAAKRAVAAKHELFLWAAA